MSTKICPTCTKEKKLEDFSKNNSRVDGRAVYCRKCIKDTGVKGRVFLKPIQKKHKATRTDASIIWAITDETNLAAFASHLQAGENGCINWTGATQNGYGKFSVSKGVYCLAVVRAHRFAWAIRHGIDALPKSLESGLASDTLVINHLCHNRACVNPDHLEAITARENSSVEKRKPKGDK